MMAGYLALPNELKDLIELAPEDLSRLSRTSKAMRRALLPRLLKSISLHWKALGPAPLISGLLGIILTSPEVAEMVEELHFHAHGYGKTKAVMGQKEWYQYPVPYTHKDGIEYRCENKPKADNIDRETIHLCREAFSSMQISGIKHEETLDDHIVDMITIVIMARCPNLKVFRLDAEFFHQNTILPKGLQRLLNIGSGNISTACSALAKLTSVHFGTIDTDWNSIGEGRMDYAFSSYLPFFYLPSLQMLSAPLLDHRDIHKPLPSARFLREWPTSPPTVCTLRTLNMCRTFADPTTLAFLLEQTPHLENLTYDFCRDASMLFDRVQLRRALRPVAATLRSLTVSYTIFSTETYEQYGSILSQEGIGSLHFLSQLTYLEIALSVLLGWDDATCRLADVLPANLQEFCMRDDCIDFANKGNVWWEEVTIEEVRHWVGQRSLAPETCTPHLKRLGLRMCESGGTQWNKHYHQTLMDICKEAGLQWWSKKSVEGCLDWDYEDDVDRVQDKVMGWYAYPKGEMGDRVKRALKDAARLRFPPHDIRGFLEEIGSRYMPLYRELGGEYN